MTDSRLQRCDLIFDAHAIVLFTFGSSNHYHHLSVTHISVDYVTCDRRVKNRILSQGLCSIASYKTTCLRPSKKDNLWCENIFCGQQDSSSSKPT